VKPPLVIYHKDCADGFCCAWLMRRAWSDAEFLAAQYGDPPPDVADRHVFILDFSYKRDVIIEMSQKARCLVVLDHHKTALAELQGLSAGSDAGLIRFDMAKSGGRLTWEYLQVRFQGWDRLPAPWLVDYTEDRDLWRWKKPQSREVNAALRSYPFDFDVWNQLHSFRSPDTLATEGEAILRAERQLVASHVARAVETEVAGYRVLAVNATVLQSEIGNELAKGRPFGATFFVRGDGARVWSLRSDDAGLDVSEVARRRGGGGHPRAAGFTEGP
jgi:uncharacterized protein